MKRNLHVVLVLALMLIMLQITAVHGAAERDVYEFVDLSSASNGKFWMDPNNPDEMAAGQYGSHTLDFISANSVDREAVIWPLTFRGGLMREQNPSYGSYYREQRSFIINEGGTSKIVSKNTGITYRMPIKTATAAEKEAIVLNEMGYNKGGSWGNYVKEKDVAINGNYKKLNFLVATSFSGAPGAYEQITATVTYEDNSISELTKADIPVCTYEGQQAENFVADVAFCGASEDSEAFNKDYTRGDSKNRVVALYEYSLELDSSKSVKNVRFINTRMNCSANIVIPAVTMTAAESNISTDITVYKKQDISPYANGKFWMERTSDDECAVAQYGVSDYLTGKNGIRLSVDWTDAGVRFDSLRENNPTYGSYYPEQQANIVKNSDSVTVTSKRSNVPYQINRTSTVSDKEVIMLNRYNTDAEKEGYIRDVNINMENEKYSGLNFLMASGIDMDHSATITAEAFYTDGTSEILENAVIPSSSYVGQVENNFVADINRMASDGSNAFSLKNANADSREFVISMYEYRLELNREKTLDRVYFITDRPAGLVTNVAICSITMEQTIKNENMSDGFEISAPAVIDGAVVVEASSPSDATAVVTVIDKSNGSLVGVSSCRFDSNKKYEKITVGNEIDPANGNYAVSVFVWNGIDSMTPLKGAHSVNLN